MERLDRSRDGNLLALSWEKLLEEKPASAEAVMRLVDGERAHSIDFYVGYNQALVNMAKLDPHLLENTPMGRAYCAILAYTEFKARDT